MRHCTQCGQVAEELQSACSRCGSAVLVADVVTDDTATLVAASGITLPPSAASASPEPSALPPEAGADFGPRYRVEALLGAGGMGRVYRAYDRELDRTVALKVIQPSLAADEEMMRRFKQELLLASRISQKNVLRIHDLGEAGGVKFISMAYIEGEDLQRRLRREGRLPPHEAARLTRQILEALAAAHEQGVVHRDLKPQNLLLDKAGNVFVTDFGLAKSLQETQAGMTQAGALLGTPRYMSPEQVEGRPTDARSDLYSLGIILYEMATGDTPFHGESAFQLMYQRVKTRPRDPRLVQPDLPPSLRQVMLRCLEPRPEDRYQSALEMLADLGGEAGSAAVPGRFPRRGTLFGSRLRLGSVAAIAVLCLAGGAAWWWSHRAPAAAPAAAAAGSIPPLARGKFVAVLPFHFLGPAGAGYVASGIADSLSARLFQLPDLHLTSRDAAAQSGASKPWKAMARDLGANLVVQGKVAAAGNRLRVIVTLDNAASGQRLWEREFDGAEGDLFTLEDEIYGGLASALQLRSTPAEMAQAVAHPTENLAAYDLYLRGRQALRAERSTAADQSAIALFTQALNKDSRFGLAYAGIADASLNEYDLTRDAFWAEKATAAADHAAQLDPNQPDVLLARGRVLGATGKTDQAVTELLQAVRLVPTSDEAYRSLGAAYLAEDKSEAAVSVYQKAVQLNPYYWLNYLLFGNCLFRLSRYSQALIEYRRVTELAPNNALGYLNSGAVLLAEGQYQASLAPLERAVALSPSADGYSNLGVAYFYLHQYAQSLPLFQKAVALRPHSELDLGNLADAQRWTGQTSQAKATYDRAITLAFQELQVNPRDAHAMGSLALYYAKEGNDSQASLFVRRARAIAPAAVDLVYIQAVVDARGGRPDAAVAALRLALARGYSAVEARQDPELSGLERRPDFLRLVAPASGH